VVVSLIFTKCTRVSGPTLPINIIGIRISLPKVFRWLVIPVDSPTVPNAETISKRDSKKLSLFKLFVWGIRNRRSDNTIRKKEITTTINALLGISGGRVRCIICTRSLPLILFQIRKKKTAKVVVFTPPPQEPGDAPINIKIINRNKLWFVK